MFFEAKSLVFVLLAVHCTLPIKARNFIIYLKKKIEKINMSLAFQSSDSIKQALFEELQNILSADKSTRNGGEENVKKLEFTEGESFLIFV